MFDMFLSNLNKISGLFSFNIKFKNINTQTN